MKNFSYPVYAIPPSFENDKIEFKSLKKYLIFLENNGAKCIMTTAGTSQFNLLSKKELRKFNIKCCKYFNGEKILGIKESNLQETIKEIKYLEDNIEKKIHDKISILVLFPERYYSNQQLIKYFYAIAHVSKFPILIHANSIKKGSGGIYEYEHTLLDVLAAHPNIIGIKEESSNWELGFELCRNVISKHENFNIIVAGGSQKRYSALKMAGAKTFLTGIGNLCPSIEENFYTDFDINKNIKKYLNKEKILFDTFMKIGWHASLRYALQLKDFIKQNRLPFIELSEEEKEQIKITLKKLKL